MGDEDTSGGDFCLEFSNRHRMEFVATCRVMTGRIRHSRSVAAADAQTPVIPRGAPLGHGIDRWKEMTMRKVCFARAIADANPCTVGTALALRLIRPPPQPACA